MSAAALDLVRYGFTVFPLQPKSKEPLKGLRWKEAASRDEGVAARYSDDCNIAVVMGRESGFVGLDIDYDDGADPEFLKQLPPSWTVKTGKGHHVYYRYPKHWPEIGKGTLLKAKSNGSGRPKPCVQLRANGHYFVAPGSIHPETGARYEWAKHEGMYDGLSCDFLAPGEIECAEAPDSILDAIANEAHVEKPAGEKYPANERHLMFIGTATAMRSSGHDEPEIYRRLVERNEQDCSPPKENAEAELKRISQWAFKTVVVDEQKAAQEAARRNREQEGQTRDEYLSAIKPLGHLGKDYFYLTQSNQQITKLSSAGHAPGDLTDLMPLSFWDAAYANGKKGTNWMQAASDMKEACRKVGLLNEWRFRGVGTWIDNNHVLHHSGDKLFIDGSYYSMLDYETKHTYLKRPKISEPHPDAATDHECAYLLAASRACAWKHKESSYVFAGALALMRICGALPWRPHIWITGPAGSGKTTIMKDLVKNMLGDHAKYFQGNTTEAGIRQTLQCDSLPVIFDEAEAEDRKTGARIGSILELARQASSDTDARIHKGTSDGKGMSFKINSCFLLSSIRVNLKQEADQTRFTVLELVRPEHSSLAFFNMAMKNLTPDIGDRIFRRMLDKFDIIMANYHTLSSIIAETSTPRHGQQYGMLIAGYISLIPQKPEVMSISQAREVAENFKVLHATAKEDVISDSIECVHAIAASRISIKLKETEPPQMRSIQSLICESVGYKENIQAMEAFGISLRGQSVVIANTHPELSKLMAGTKWADGWWRSLQRIEGAERGRHRFEKGAQIRVTIIPLSVFIDPSPALDIPDTFTV